MKRVLAALLILAMCATTGYADYLFTQGSSQVAYSDHNIDFEDAPTGVSMDPFDFYQASDGVTFASGSGFLVAEAWDDLEGIDGGESPGGIQLNGGFGISILFDKDVAQASWQGWANGNPSPPLGGINVFLFNDGGQVAFYSGISPFGGVGDEWFSVEATDGDTFDEVRFFNGAFNSFNSYIDNVTFNDLAPIPEPASALIVSLAGLCLLRRQR